MTPERVSWGRMVRVTRLKQTKTYLGVQKRGNASATLPALHRFVLARADRANTLTFYIINNSEHCSSASCGISEFRGLSEPDLTQSLSQTVPVLTFALILFPARNPTSQVKWRETEIKKKKNTNHCDVLLIVLRRGLRKKKRRKSIAN